MIHTCRMVRLRCSGCRQYRLPEVAEEGVPMDTREDAHVGFWTVVIAVVTVGAIAVLAWIGG